MFAPIGNQKLMSVPPYGARSSFKVWSGPRPSSGGDFFRLTPARGFWAVTSAGNFRAGLPGGAFHLLVPVSTSYFRRDELISRHNATPPAPQVHTSHTRHTKNRQRVGSRTFAAQMWAKRERRTAGARDWAGAEGGRWREG